MRHFVFERIFKTPSTGFDDGNVYVRKADLEKVAGLNGTHEIAILLTSNNDPELKQLLAFTHSILPPESKDLLSVRPWQEIQPLLSTMMSTMDVSNQVMLVVFVLAMTLGIINIMLMSVFERTREFGVLMAVGMQKHKIRLLIVFETLFLGLSGCALGLLGSAIMLKMLSITGLSPGWYGGRARGLWRGYLALSTGINSGISNDHCRNFCCQPYRSPVSRTTNFEASTCGCHGGEKLMTIKLQNLTKIYNADGDYPVHAVQSVDLEIKQGEFVAIMGPSGSGKTTLLNMIGGIDAPSSGKVEIDGCMISSMSEKELIAYRRDNIGFIFQDYSLLPVLTALENMWNSSCSCKVKASESVVNVRLPYLNKWDWRNR